MDNQLSFVFDEDTEELHFSDEMKEIKTEDDTSFDDAIEAIESAKRLAAELEEQAVETVEELVAEPVEESSEESVEDAFGESSQEIKTEDAFEECTQEITVGGQVRTKYARDTYLVRKIMDNIAIVENPATKDTHEICLKDLIGV
ncbi:hypothetical protein SAMN02910453_1928 [Lachnospiraceae bacterium A10]|nr:hypothetical protein SAMN02910453_1928 [Lachnospiraceae bacterium A10]